MMTRKVLNIRALLLALFISVSIGVFAQTSVKGVVLEPSGEPAIGATIMEKGTSVGTATDFDGNFSIKVASPNAVLVVSYVGMETQEVKLAGRADLTITLKESGVSLDEVVVVGYGTMKKSDLAGASVSMSEDDLKGSSSPTSTSRYKVVQPVCRLCLHRVLPVLRLLSACAVSQPSTLTPSLFT